MASKLSKCNKMAFAEHDVRVWSDAVDRSIIQRCFDAKNLVGVVLASTAVPRRGPVMAGWPRCVQSVVK